ncbi:ribosome maturation factor RimP [Desulfonema magnum]|uniref:Ribosome maturation factor RimP n=1 Tax=Desulfonema magnum TaxID=45655 RepID=A0A975GTT0_9BACT|nr:ribosome maturation factor RimP [Desulfonema magnum]QTA93386.1 Ribosomal maturation factor [Desulfonema magnum]
MKHRRRHKNRPIEKKASRSGKSRRQTDSEERDSQKDEKKRDHVKAEEIRQIAEPLCEAEGMELAHVEYQREAGGRVLRLYIDRPGGVTLNDCVYISRQVNDLLDVHFMSSGIEDEPYNLEVSSPGPNRPLGKRTDFERFRGKKVKIRTLGPVDGKKNIQGVLAGLSEEIVPPSVSGLKSDPVTSEVCVKLLVDDKILLIPYQEITRARLVPEKVD